MNKKRIIAVSIQIMLVTIAVWISLALTRKETFDEIPMVSYTDFLNSVKTGTVDLVVYSSSDEVMTFYEFNDETKEMDSKTLEDYIYPPTQAKHTLYPAYEDFRKDMLTANVRLKINSKNKIISVISALSSLLIPALYLYFIYRAMRSQTKGLDLKTVSQTSTVKFADIIGQDELLEDVKFVSSLIKNPGQGAAIGAQVPKGMLLIGPPGTGKTLLAKAIAGEAGVPFFQLSGSDFKEMFVGLGAKRVRDLFAMARKNAPCIVFIDEIDSVGAKRSKRVSSSEDDQTINALLKEMDGFTGREGIFVIAATNREDSLDSALVRPGRFDRKVHVNPPRDWKVRKQLFAHYLSKLKVADDVDVEGLAKQVVGFTGADIATVCNEAGIIAIMKQLDCVNHACLEEAIDKQIFKGNRSKAEGYVKDKNIVAYHEAAHAVMTHLCGEPISRASILATTSGVGGAVFGADTDSVFMTDKSFRDRIKIAYAGHASEELKFETVTTGASNDITQATQLMLSYIQRYGFDKEYGLIDISVLTDSQLIPGEEITKRISEMSKTFYNQTKEELKQHFDLVEVLAKKLIECETLTGKEIEELLRGTEPKQEDTEC